MGLTSLQVCMDSSDWLQEECGLDSSSSPSGDMLTCSRPLIERRLRPPHEQALKCPRCESTHTKFCYYNNYSLSQPRYFCKTCRRYWTKGGTLRNIPVGGGCRKNKKVATKKSNEPHPHPHPPHGSSSPTDLHLSFPEMQLSHLNNILASNSLLENNNAIRQIDFMESKLEAIVGSSRNYDFMGNGLVGDVGHAACLPPNLHAFCSPYAIDHGIGIGMSNTLMLPYDHANEDHAIDVDVDVKPNTKLLSLDWQEQDHAIAAKPDTYAGYLNNMGSWTTGIINNYGPSATNPLV